MTGRQLKDSILLSAFSGAFVEHHYDDNSIFQRVLDVKKEQERLIKAKKIKKEKYNSTISEREDSLPQNWTVIKLGDISKVITKQTGFDYSNHIKPNLVDCPSDDVIPMLQTRNFKGKSFDFHTEYYIPKQIALSFPKICLDEPCLLLSIVGASIGNVGYLEQPREAIIGGAICKVTIIPAEFYDYIFYYLQSPQGCAEIKKNLKATAQGTIMVQDVREIEIPLPPYEEQCRIVQKIEQLFPFVDEYDKAAEELNALNDSLPDKLRKSVLQEAIHGNLVPNDIPDDEATAPELLQQILQERQNRENATKGAKAKRLTLSIIEDEPWELPDGWCWTRLGDIMTFVNGRAYKKEELLSSGKYKVLRVGNFFTNDSWYYSDLELPDEKYCIKGDLLYAWSASFGPWIWEGDKTIFHYHIWNVKFNEDILCKKYLYWFFEADKHIIKESTTGSTMVHVSMENMMPRLIPIPPLSIQHRIVEKIEEVFAAIDKLQA